MPANDAKAEAFFGWRILPRPKRSRVSLQRNKCELTHAGADGAKVYQALCATNDRVFKARSRREVEWFKQTGPQKSAEGAK